MSRPALLFLVLLTLCLPASAAETYADRPAIRAFLESAALRSVPLVGLAASESGIAEFYAAREYEPLWTGQERITPQARELLRAMSASHEKGLRPDDYSVESLARQAGSVDTPEERARFDVFMTASAFSFLSDLHVGRVYARRVLASYEVDQRIAAIPSLVSRLADAPDVEFALQEVEPKYRAYVRLEEALKRYREMLRAGDQKPLPADKVIKPESSWSARRDLAAFLQRTGDLGPGSVPSKYTGSLVSAVKKFQRRHGLPDDGVLGPATFRALNVPLSERVRQIELSMERWRWLPWFERPPVLVNVPEFRLLALDEQQHPALSMKVIVGQAYTHNTPVFQSAITELIFFPHWNVPPSIQHEEIVPALAKDRGYLARHGYQAIRGDGSGATSNVTAAVLKGLRNGSLMIRQKPGPGNSLGKLKFVLPNDKNVYLHDTPEKSLFGKTRRDLSHGCIRVEQPAKLAEWVLRSNRGWTDQRIQSALRAGKTSNVGVAEPPPLLIMYATAVASESGEIHFFEDIYGYDQRLQRELDERGTNRPVPAP